MSTTLKNIKALVEVPDKLKRESDYKETEVQLTRFYGGKERGVSLQLGFLNEEGDYQSVQLDNNSVRDLIRELVFNFV